MAPQEITHQHWRKLRHTTPDCLHHVRCPQAGTFSLRPDRGIDEHEPVDPLRMTRGQPRRDSAAKGVPGDVCSR
jgi:hypothetical protein